MKRISGLWPRLLVVAGLGIILVSVVLLDSGGGLAQPMDSGSGDDSRAVAMMGAAPSGTALPPAASVALGTVEGGILSSLADRGGSSVESEWLRPDLATPTPVPLGDSGVETDFCYETDATQTFCFTVYNGSPNHEWLDQITLTFPDDPGGLSAWTVSSCVSQDSTDSLGHAVAFSCTPSGNQVVYADNDGDDGEIADGATWSACVEVAVPAGYTGDRYIPWVLHGDYGSSKSGSLRVERCTPLRLWPARADIAGCNGVPREIEFTLENHSGSSVEVHFTYDATDAEFSGTTGPYVMASGDAVTLATVFVPGFYLEPGEIATAQLTAYGGGYEDTSLITETITSTPTWEREGDSPETAMDNVVIWANHADGGLWSVGGYSAATIAQRYDPDTGTWVTYTDVLSPAIEYPMDGCYGLRSDGDEIVVLFPDTVTTGTLQIWNITDRVWYQAPVPTPGYPPEGRWAQDVVSMLQHTGENVCYLSGGATSPGGGNTRDLWKYYPAENVAEYLGHFKSTTPFDFHASWYVPWVGAAGAICVAGGVDQSSTVLDMTQCYDLQTHTFRSPNVDLGTLPEPWWGMADGWRDTREGYELWVANGADSAFALLPASAFIRDDMNTFIYGPPVPVGLYRLEGDAWGKDFYTLGGSSGGFASTPTTLRLVFCPECYTNYLPLTLKSYQ